MIHNAADVRTLCNSIRYVSDFWGIFIVYQFAGNIVLVTSTETGTYSKWKINHAAPLFYSRLNNYNFYMKNIFKSCLLNNWILFFSYRPRSRSGISFGLLWIISGLLLVSP